MDRENDLRRGRWQQGYRNECRQSHPCRYDLCAVYGANGGWEADPGYHENQNETRDVTSMARYTTHSQLEKLTMLLKTLILSVYDCRGVVRYRLRCPRMGLLAFRLV